MLTLTYVLICFYSNVVNKKKQTKVILEVNMPLQIQYNFGGVCMDENLRVGSKQGNKNRSDSRAVGSK